MLFSSGIFLFIFFPLVVLAFFWLSRSNVKSALFLLTFSSFVFYGWEEPAYIFILLFSIVVNWGLGNILWLSEAVEKRRYLLLLMLVVNVMPLFYFKYSYFFLENASVLLNAVSCCEVSNDVLTSFSAVILPVGISFYTFQAISYNIDVYLRKTEPSRSLLEFACYISMFPQLVAGPIVRYSHIKEQLFKPVVTQDDIEVGLHFFVLGFAKKVLIADTLAPYADYIFDEGVSDSGYLVFLGVIAYSLQLYFDFSGYSEMAVGIGRMMGFKFPQNFNSPYKSRSITEFWRRWHISLSSWIRDYIYIPLGGNRGGGLAALKNIVITMFIAGLWHGASWNFAVWGVGHGFALVVDHKFFVARSQGVAFLRHMWMFFMVILLWIPFRAHDMGGVYHIFSSFVNLDLSHALRELRLVPKEGILSLLVLLPSLYIVFRVSNVYEIEKEFTLRSSILLSLLYLVSVVVVLSRDYVPFLYFQF